MKLHMNDSHVVSISQIIHFLKHTQAFSFKPETSCKERYAWISNTISKFHYPALSKRQKSIVKQYIMKITGFSDSHIKRLIVRKKKTGCLIPNSSARHSFPTIYTSQDIARLIETDRLHKRLSAPATVKIFKEEYSIYGDKRFERLQNISPAHIYNLRKTNQYKSHSSFFEKTRPTNVSIGERRKPENQGRPGYLRVDTVHQGDYVDNKGNKKGVYHINIVDEVTQWQVVGAVEGISEAFLVPLLEQLILQFPFKMINFHSDNGSEYINKVVAKLLNKLLIKQTKSRPRHSNDNALAETKIGAVIRKHMGYAYIPQRYAEKINEFYQKYFNLYLNYHRPSGYATRKQYPHGKIKKVYNVYQTPFNRLKSLFNASTFLKKGITMRKLEKIALEMSHNDSARQMQEAKQKLFKSFKV